jgi:hypothetical protein
MYFVTASGGCAALCGGSPAKLSGFGTVSKIFVHVLKSTSENDRCHFNIEKSRLTF